MFKIHKILCFLPLDEIKKHDGKDVEAFIDSDEYFSSQSNQEKKNLLPGDLDLELLQHKVVQSDFVK